MEDGSGDFANSAFFVLLARAGRTPFSDSENAEILPHSFDFP
jgi:hypothetical protein